MSPFLRATATAAWLIGLLAPAVLGADDPPASGVRLGSTRLRHAAVWLAWAPDGKTFASVGRDGAIRVWDSADGKQLHEFKVRGVSFQSVVFDPEAKSLLASDVAGDAHVLDAATGAESHLLHSSPQQIVALAWRPDGSVATLARGGVLRIWDLKTDKIVRQSGDSPKPGVFTTEALAADGGRFAVWARDDNRVKVWEADGKQLFQVQLPPVFFANYLAFTTDGKTLAVYSSTGQVVLWDADTGTEAQRLNGVFVNDGSLAFSPNGRYLIGRPGDGGSVHMWGVTSGNDLRELDLPLGLPSNGGGQTTALSPDGKRLIAARGSAIHVWNVETCTEVSGFVGHNAPVVSVCFSADGRSVFTSGQDGAVGQWEPATGKRLAWRLRPTEGLLLPTAAADGKIGVFGRGSKWRRWGLDDQSEEAPNLTGVEVGQLYCSPAVDGKTVAYLPQDGFVHIQEVETGKDRTRVKLDKPFFSTYALSPDGRFLAVGSNDAPTRLFDASTGAEVRSFSAAPAAPGAPAKPAQGATTLLFTPDGRTLACVYGKDLTFFETATGRERLRAAWPGAPAGRPVFSLDGTVLAVPTPAGSAALLDTADGAVLTELPGDLGAVRSLAFAANGKALAAGGEDGTALVWDIKEYSGRRRPAELAAARLPPLWDDLQDGDAGRAYQAILALAASPKAAAPFLKERAGAKGPDERQIAHLIKDLDDDSFDVRENAQKELEKLGLTALPAVQQALDARPSAEARQRLQRVLDKHKGVVLVSEEVRDLRALEALERSGAPEAVEALRALAKDAPNAAVNQEAAAALARMERRMGP